MKRKQNARHRLTALLIAAALMLCAVPSALSETFSAIVTASSMTVYSDAKLTKAAGKLDQGEVVQVTAYSGKAARISYEGREGYARVSDMKSVESVAAKGVVNADSRVYSRPAGSGDSVKIAEGSQVYVLRVSDGWALVEKDGELGYMQVSALTKANDDWSTGALSPTPTPSPEQAEKGVVSAMTLPVYKKPDTSSGKLGTLKQGQEVSVLRYNNKWAYIEINGRYGYCAVKGLSKDNLTAESGDGANRQYYRVVVSKLPVYEKKSTSSKKLGTLKLGRTVALLSMDGDWAHIEMNGNKGYVASKGISDVDVVIPSISPTATPSVENAASGTVNVASLPVYRTASAKGDKIATLSRGDRVNVLKWNSQWAFIEKDGNYGFCPVSGLTRTEVNPTEKTAAAPSLDTAVQATVKDDSVVVYRTASTSSADLGTLMWGEKVNVLSVADGWAYIEKNGRYGFCKSSALEKTEADPDETPSDYVQASFTATVIDPNAKVYEKASTGSASTSVTLGAELNVIAYSRDLKWACVTNNVYRGFIPIASLNRGKYETVTGSGAKAQTLLKALLTYGYYDGLTTASASSEMAVAAVKRFQAACGLPQNGVADQTVQRILYGGCAPASDMLSMSLSLGSTGENVSRLQTRLYALGYLSQPASLDGNFGSTTAMAVGLFQQANGISATGTADGTTLKAIYSPSAVKKPSGVKAAEENNSLSISGGGSAAVVSVTGKVTLSSTYVTEMPSSLKSTVSSYNSGMSSALKLEHAIYSAQEKLGKPYVYGATGPNSFDCSGLTQYSFKTVGVSLKRSAYSQGYDSGYDKITGVENLRRGDLVFFNTISDSDLSDHVGIYLGGGCFIHASSGGHKVVVSNLTTGYYNRVFSWGRRILK